MAKRYNKVKKKYTKGQHNKKNIIAKIFLLPKKILVSLSNKMKYMKRSVVEIKSRELKAKPLLKGFNILCEISPLWILLALAVNSIIGFCIIYFTNSFEEYWLHIVCITFCIFLTIIICRKYMKTLSFLDDEINIKNTLED